MEILRIDEDIKSQYGQRVVKDLSKILGLDKKKTFVKRRRIAIQYPSSKGTSGVTTITSPTVPNSPSFSQVIYATNDAGKTWYLDEYWEDDGLVRRSRGKGKAKPRFHRR